MLCGKYLTAEDVYEGPVAPTGRAADMTDICLKAPTNRPDIQLPYVATLQPLCCLLFDLFGRKVALNTST